MVAGQNLHPLTSSLESVGYSADMHWATQQLNAAITIQKGKRANDELKAQIATLEGTLQIQHRNTPSCPFHQQLRAKIAILEGKLNNLHSWTTGPESVGFSADMHQYLQNLHQQVRADITRTSLGHHHTKG